MICGERNPTYSHGKMSMKEIICAVGGVPGVPHSLNDHPSFFSCNNVPNVTQRIITGVS